MVINNTIVSNKISKSHVRGCHSNDLIIVFAEVFTHQTIMISSTDFTFDELKVNDKDS